jgi:hypothetical protein
MKKSYLGYLIEGIVISLSILLSLFLGNINESYSDTEKKNNYLKDLSITLEEDIDQIRNLISILNNSEDLIIELQNDIDKKKRELTSDEIISILIKIEVGFSFFPQDGVFNQMISTGSFELIENTDLKKNLLEMYNHQIARNYATSQEIDNFNIKFRGEPYNRFRIRFDYNLLDGEFYGTRKLTSYDFDESYYKSNSFYGLLSQAKLYSNMYKRQLNDILDSYEKTLLLIKQEGLH